MSNYFLAYDKLVDVVLFCGRITDVNDKDYHQRLIIDDGTSAILALVKKRFDENNLDETQCDDETFDERSRGSLIYFIPLEMNTNFPQVRNQQWGKYE